MERYEAEPVEDNGGSPERTVARIRELYRAAETANGAGESSQAERLHKAADELMDRFAARWLKPVEQTACRIMGREHELYHEAVSEAFCKLTREIRETQRETNLESSFLPCLMRILADVRTDLLRKFVERDGGSKVVKAVGGDPLTIGFNDGDAERPTLDGLERSLLDSAEDPEARLAFEEAVGAEVLRKAKDRMSAQQADVLTLATSGMSFVKISRRLGIDRGTASAEYKRAERILKSTLARGRTENA